MAKRPFIEVDYYQKFKENQLVGGDTFMSRKYKEERRTISVLSDGLGSGIKANVLSTLTTTMALNYISNRFDIEKTAQVIMKTLPVCKTRKISYSTFSIVDIDESMQTRIVEYDNPSFILVRDNKIMPVGKSTIELGEREHKKDFLHFSNFQAEMGDCIILFSDGVTQSGMGTRPYPLGWGEKAVQEFIGGLFEKDIEISARDLANRIVQKAYANDQYKASDDITCGVIHVREPRELLVMTGPPIDPKKDKELAEIMNSFSGKKVICGGTTTKILSRELDRNVKVNLKDISPDVPPTSEMEGVDLVTEGTITMAKVTELLEKDLHPNPVQPNGATRLVDLFLNSDIIHFVVGTKINDAHQDPNVPVELEIRRNIIKQIRKLLEEKHLKETRLQFI